jgi:DNA-binding NarL/FixJ family response regulator
VTNNDHEGNGCPFCPFASGGVPALHRLTPRELEISLAVARGSTNREVGQSLHMSPKTVEVHLSAVFRKLGIRSRTALAALVASEARPA